MKQILDIKYQVARLSIVTLVFDHAFSLGKFISLPIFFSVCFLFFNALDISKKNYSINVILSLVFFLLFITFANTINAINISDTTEFLQGYRLFFYVSYFIFFSSVLCKVYSVHQVIEWLYISFIIATVFGLIYFVLQNFIGIDLDLYIYRPSVIENSGSVSSTLRNRSFFEEAGNFSFYLNLVFPIILFCLKDKKEKFKLFFVFILYFLSVLSTFSAAGIVVFLVISILLSIRKQVVSGVNISNYFRLLTASVFIVIFYLYLQGNEFVNFALNKILNKILFNAASSESASARLDGYSVGFEYINNLYTSGNYFSLLFGSGTGATKFLFNISIVSGQLVLLIEQGILFMLCFYLLFFAFTYYAYIKSHHIIYYSGLTFFIYQFSITNYSSMFVVVCLYLLLEITREKTNYHNCML